MKRALRLSLVTLLATGCLVSRPEIPQPECTVDSECSDGKVCGPAGKCVDQCKADADCVSPRTCVSGACKLPTGVCVTSADCSSGDVCGLGNTCSKACTTASNCGANEACIGGACTSLSAGLCALNSDCASGESCVQGRCAAACSTNVDCTSPRTCQSGACLLPTGKCVVNGDCMMGEVCGVGGACTSACTSAAQCDPNEACIGGACTSLASGACRFNSECPAPQACVLGRCSEACVTSRDCPFGTACDTGFCSPQPPECLDATDCMAMETCSPQGECVRACTSVSDCAATGEACSNGACVRVGVDTATLAGSVVLTGVSNASNLTVTLDGPNRTSARTAMNGSYSFQGLLPGLYTVRVDAPNTLEARAEREVAVRAGVTTTAPTFTFTPAGTITGTVTLAGRTSHEGIQVAALGTGLGTVTGPNGSYVLRGVPVGTYDLLFAYTGFQSAQATGVAVTYATSVSTTSVALQPLPSGSTFAFSSVPPTSTRIDQPFTYQAVAGGGGVSSVTYALVDSTTGPTMNPTTGQLTWASPRVGTWWFVLSASGGGATVYQIFYLTVTQAATLVVPPYIDTTEVTSTGIWLKDNLMLAFFAGDAGLTRVADPLDVTGTIASREQLNGRTVTSYSFPGGTLSGLDAPFGTLGGTWQGGVVQSITGVDVRTVQSVTVLGGTSGTATAPTGDTLSALAWETGPITSLSDGRSQATAFRANTGFLSNVTSTTVEDAAATWTPNAFAGQCVQSADGNTRLTITSHTATTFTLASDPTALLGIGQRYFLGQCSGPFTLYTLVDANRDAGVVAAGNSIDVYSPTGVNVGQYTLTATTPPPNATLTFQSSPALFNVLSQALTTGFYAVGATSGGVDLVVTDSSAPWSTSTSTNRRFTFDDYAPPLIIRSSTATTLTVRAGFGVLGKDRTGRNWVLTDTSNNVQVTATLATGGLTPSSLSNTYLWVDARGTPYLINDNTANTVLLDVPYTDFPLAQLTGTLVGRSATYSVPGIVVPTTGLAPGSMASRFFVRMTNGSTPFVFSSTERIVSNTSTSVTVSETSCSTCVGGLAQRLASASNVRWAPGNIISGVGYVDTRIVLQGASFTPETLIGRTVTLESNPSVRAAIIHNDATSITVELSSNDFGLVQALSAGDRLWLSESGNASTAPLRVKLRGEAATWTPNEWVGFSVITGTNLVVGTITANTSNELDLTVTNPTAFAALSAGSNFAFAKAHVQGVGCATSSLWIRADLTLAGATLAPNAYTHVRSEVSGTANRLQLFSNGTNGAVAYVCSANFSNLIGMMGRSAVLDTNGTFDLTLTDSTGTLTPGAHVGAYVYFTSNTTGRFQSPITGNTATTIAVRGIDSTQWFNGFPWRGASPGTRFAITDVNNIVQVVANVTPTLTAGALNGRYVRLKDRTTSSSGAVMAVVASNTANTVTLGDLTANDADNLRSATSPITNLTLSRGSVVRLTPATGGLVPNALVGRALRFGVSVFYVIANTASTITAVASDHDAYARSFTGTTFNVNDYDWEFELSSRPNGNVLAVRDDGRIGEATPAGALSWVTPLTGAQQLTVSPQPLVAAGLFANNATVGTYSTTWSQSTWSFAPGSLANGYIRAPNCGSPQAYLIATNTATSVTSHDAVSCPGAQSGRSYAIDTARLTVSGSTLTPGALRGKRLWVNGYEYLVRDNTATELQLMYGDDYVSVLLDAIEPGATAFIVSGPQPVRDEVATVTALGATGFVAGLGGSLFTFDGTQWSRTDSVQVRAPVRTGTVGLVTANNTIVDLAGGLTPNALAGKRLMLFGTTRSITSNTTNTITVSTATANRWVLQIPVPGTSYAVYDDDGLSGIQVLRHQGSTLWVGTSNGLWRQNGSGWTQFTIANTESTPGAIDGLRSNDIEYLRAFSNGHVYASNGYEYARYDGTSWQATTVANTESAPGRADGLPDSYTYDFWLDGTGALWVSMDVGAARRVGNTWSLWGPSKGLDDWVIGVWLSPSGNTYLATGGGLFELAP